jgi:hydrogenase maturation protease
MLDIGTPGLGVDQHFAGVGALIVIDTVRVNGEPGEVRTYRREQILQHGPGLRMSPHDPGLKEALLSLEFSGVAPQEVVSTAEGMSKDEPC